VERLFLANNPQLTDIRMLGKLKVLSIEKCPLLSLFPDLKSLMILVIGRGNKYFWNNGELYLPKFPLPVTMKMKIPDTCDLTAETISFHTCMLGKGDLSLLAFKNSRSISLKLCSFSEFPEGFIHLQSLSLTTCSTSSSASLPAFPALQFLKICECSEFKQLKLGTTADGLSSISKVVIDDCSKLFRLEVSYKISQFVILNCPVLLEIVANHEIDLLRIRKCNNLKCISRFAPINCRDYGLAGLTETEFRHEMKG
jgi:hypothetical protein